MDDRVKSLEVVAPAKRCYQSLKASLGVNRTGLPDDNKIIHDPHQNFPDLILKK
jgi:hypothetical protein